MKSWNEQASKPLIVKIRLAEMIELVSDELLYAESLRSKRKHIMRFDECELIFDDCCCVSQIL